MKLVIYRIYEIIYGLYRISFWKLFRRKRRIKDFYYYEKYKDNINIIENYLINKTSKDEELLKTKKYIIRNGIANVFPYDFVNDYYLVTALILRFDSECSMYYIQRRGKRLYLKQTSYTDASNYCRNLLCEQNRKSPHLYSTHPLVGDVMLDCGAAEGILALDNLDTFKQIYLFEADKSWLPALEKTFHNYKEKVKILNKYVTNHNSNSEITLDSFLEGRKIRNDANVYIKIDVEGVEQDVLEGLKNTLKNYSKLRMAICTYHNQEDESCIRKTLEEYNKFDFLSSKGYMILFYAKDLKPPYLRRGILRVSIKGEPN